ncbi:MAG: immune inhibitor A [Desulfosarcinaceae bacterium]
MDSACNPTGRTGEWNAFTGNSNGWRQVTIDLSDYAGQKVDLYIGYVSDWGTQGLGVFVDDIELGGNPPQDFEAGLDPWEPTSTEGNLPYNNWIRMTGAGFSEGPVIRTESSVLMGFGFEAIAGAETRGEVMQRVMDYLITK